MLNPEEFVLTRLAPHCELVLLTRKLVTEIKVVGSALDALTASEAKGTTAPEALHCYVFFELI